MARMVFQKILEEGSKKGTLPRATRRATKWYRQQAKQTRTTPRQLWDEERLKHYSLQRQLIGNMYFFFYDPESKKSLPYWDTFPLVMPIELATGGFLGLNFHYLNLKLRAVLMDRLSELELMTKDPVDKSEQSQKGKLDWRNIDYSSLSQFAKYKYFRPCLKRYKFANMRSRLIQLDRDEWDIALFLPLEKFEKDRKIKVWEDSNKTIFRGNPPPR